MKNIIADINKAFESRVRLGIMSILMVQDEVDFNSMKEILNLTDGNLASHLKALEKIEYIIMVKEFVGRKPRTSYSITKLGKHAFQEHLKALEKLIKGE
ncbi:MAG: transcriptional regulator [Bacteroidales bacterium]|nr:transcriptional regulator [Bacteroidales bacterium]